MQPLALLLVALLALSACSNSRLGEAAERSLAADPRLETNPNPFGQPSQPGTRVTARLPANYPSQIPLYPRAQLQEVTGESSDNPILTRWTSADPAFRVQSFYQQALTEQGWEIVNRPTEDTQGTFVARLNGLEVTIAIGGATPPTGASPQTTGSQFSIQSQPVGAEGSAEGTGDGSSFEVSGAVSPESAEPQANSSSSLPSGSDTEGSLSPQNFTDLAKVPQSFRPWIEDLAALGVLEGRSPQGKTETSAVPFDPNRVVTRREYARWLTLANNRLYGDRPAQQIRLGTEEAQPAFKDVARSDPDFPYIQGLAEAGIIPSGISGDSTITLFRPDAPLTREALLLWKVPLDSRQALPPATVDAIKQTWGFQDAGRIDPRSLRSVLADYQNGDLSNIRRVLGFTTLLQPKRGVTRAEAAATLWYFGSQSEGISAREVLQGSKANSTP